jgi:riboflavin kinase/FMN adenylyltransferase
VKVIWGLDRVDPTLSSITTLGSFDGVHRGHLQIVEALVEHQTTLGLDRSIVVTFHPHPQQVLRRNNSTVQLLTTIDERLELLSRTGVDEVVVIEFTPEFSRKTYVDFFHEILLEKLRTKAMVVGFNHAFGKNREGDLEHLEELGKRSNIPIYKVGPSLNEGTNISSTRIRKSLLAGEVEDANRCLGRNYAFKGVVISGDHLGRTLDYPTANLKIESEKLLPGDGVYACRVDLHGKVVSGAMSIGHRPTLGEGLARVVEVFLFDFSEEIYGEHVCAECIGFLRMQEQFETMDLLRKQIQMDVAKCRTLLQN